MKKLILVTLLSFFGIMGYGKGFNGYIITLDNLKISGQITSIYYAKWGSKLTFKNEMGNVYQLAPYLIQGFAFFDETGTKLFYESKYFNRDWYFVKVAYKADVLSLYRSPDKKKFIGNIFDNFRVIERPTDEYWIEFPGKKITALYDINYKKILKRKLAAHPELAQKIGLKGYRLKDMLKIVQEYCDFHDQIELEKS